MLLYVTLKSLTPFLKVKFIVPPWILIGEEVKPRSIDNIWLIGLVVGEGDSLDNLRGTVGGKKRKGEKHFRQR